MEQGFLVTGAKGMLGSAVLAHLRGLGDEATGTDLPEVDLTDGPAVERLIGGAGPSHVIHCAAYTNVDGAESEAEACRAANVAATANLARACANAGAAMLMVSTDFVFDGTAREPYAIDAATNPLGVYARSKLEGEQALAGGLERHQIVRTAWLYGRGGRNFVLAILGRLRQGEPLRVVADQIGSPTYTLDLAERLVGLARLEAFGVFHVTNAGQCSWHEFAREIARLSGFAPDSIEAIGTADWPSPARRPAWSVLDCSRAWQAGLEPMRPWQEALADYLDDLPKPAGG